MIKGINLFFLKITKRHKIKIIQDLSSRRSFIIIGLMRGKKIIFKLRKTRIHNSIQNFKTEVLMCKVLNSKQLKNAKSQTREIIDYSLDYPQWLIFEYRKGDKSAGKECKHWCFSKDFYKINPPEKMFAILKFWRGNITDFIAAKKYSLSSYALRQYNFSKIYTDFINASKFYFRTYLRRNPSVEQIYYKNDQEKAEMVLKKFKDVIEANNNYICHGDFNPWNILIYKKHNIILDLETVHYDIPCVDLAFIWSAAWNNLRWRNKLFNLFLKEARDKKLFKIFFNLCLVRFMPKVFVNVKLDAKKNKKFKRVLLVFRKDFQEAIKYLSVVK